MSKQETVFGVARPVALVTGSGDETRIGNSIAWTLAKRGYRLLVHAHRSQADAATTVEKMEAAGHQATFRIADLRQPEQVRNLVDEAFAWQQRLDVVVNAAAVWQAKRLEDVTAADLESHWQVNTQATFLCCQQAGLKMCQQPMGGAIINLGDWATTRPYVGYAAYFPSKGAIGTLTRDFAVELATRHPRVRVNAVLPGPVTLPAEMASEMRAAAIKETLLRREGSRQHVADAVVALIENDYITGAILPVNGGRSIFVAGEAEWRLPP